MRVQLIFYVIHLLFVCFVVFYLGGGGVQAGGGAAARVRDGVEQPGQRLREGEAARAGAGGLSGDAHVRAGQRDRQTARGHAHSPPHPPPAYVNGDTERGDARGHGGYWMRDDTEGSGGSGRK